jgi:Eco57I restriction-modification methylase
VNRTNLKSYAPQARRDFIQAVTDRAAYYGLTATKIEPVVERGDVAVIAGREHPRPVAKKRKQLEERIKQHGFKQTMGALAYTWFNRLVAIRFMELHGYLDHGYRVLSHPESKPTPEIIEHAEHVELPRLKKEVVIDLKLAGNKESELYRMLLIAQCNALHTAMPFLFERIDDETELLLPDNLLHSDSLIRKLVSEIDEEDWREVEIIGWLYQFYISEKHDEVIGKVVASEDIPAATQLFTPNWIVKYLVQNTLGRQWLATYPQSALRQQMPYYIEPAEQMSEVQQHLKAITPTSLNPEELTLLDPACGSGHILVEAYDLFKAIYQERGYRAKDIPTLILQKNLFGLEIDDRAAQLAAFAVMMKARADDRRIFDSDAKPNILAFQDSQGMSAAGITHALNSPINKDDVPRQYLFEELDEEKAGLFSRRVLAEKGHVFQGDIATMLELFKNAKTFGSLIQVPPKLAERLPEIERRLNDVLKHGDLTHAPAYGIKAIIQQARLLAGQYDAVVANPPYMGISYFISLLKEFVGEYFEQGKSDLYSAFMLRNAQFTSRGGFVGMITIPNWMSTSGFEPFRQYILTESTFESLLHNGRGVWGSDFGSCSFVQRRLRVPKYKATYLRLFDVNGSVASSEELEKRFFVAKPFFSSADEFERIPGTPLLYWASEKVKALFSRGSLGSFLESREGLATADNGRFLRQWYEVPHSHIGFSVRNTVESVVSRRKWFPYVKGGDFRKWYGNVATVVNWRNDGEDIKANVDLETGRVRSHNYNGDYGFRAGLTWSGVSISALSVRHVDEGFMFDATGPMAYAPTPNLENYALAVLNSRYGHHIVSLLAPTVHFKLGHVMSVPCSKDEALVGTAAAIAQKCVKVAREDWNSVETSWDFQTSPLRRQMSSTLQLSVKAADEECVSRFNMMKVLEEENNHLFIEAYGLLDELSPKVPDDEISLYVPDREEDIKRLLLYVIGCMLGRYSLDKPGLVYAHGGNQGFDPDKYETFRADDDGIVPLLETDWGIQDDAANRTVEFIGVSWPKRHLEANLRFVADSLGPANREQPRDTIRRYLATGFYKHHLSMYKRRPIYWLFSSGKQRAFQCLAYLHRYHEGTLARMRTVYVIPLQGQIAARIEQLEGDKTKATSTSHRRKLQKEQDDLKKQQTELIAFEERLKHAADQKISLDLDDGVKVNYGKFGDLLAESKAITGSKEDE